MNVNVGRILAVMLKELREYRRSPFIIGTMAVLPLIFLIEPIVDHLQARCVRSRWGGGQVRRRHVPPDADHAGTDTGGARRILGRR